MLEVANVSVMNWGNAIRGARNPLGSWGRCDSFYNHEGFNLGKNDLELLTKLCKAGPDHRKFMRQIFVSMDICAPLYWWKEFDTYKVGVTANSTSTMHTLHKQPIDILMFSFDDVYPCDIILVEHLEHLRQQYVATGDKDIWREIIQRLPSGFNQLRTVTMTYENLVNIYHARKNHKLTEWHTLCEAIEKLEYAKELIVDIKK